MRGSKTEVFEGKTLSGLLKDIFNISKDKRVEIKSLIAEYTKMIKTPADIILIAPLIQQLLEVSVKNDDQLTKVATIVQRVISADAYQKNSGDPSDLLTEEEKEQLFKNTAKELADVVKDMQSDLERPIPKLPKTAKVN